MMWGLGRQFSPKDIKFTTINYHYKLFTKSKQKHVLNVNLHFVCIFISTGIAIPLFIKHSFSIVQLTYISILLILHSPRFEKFI